MCPFNLSSFLDHRSKAATKKSFLANEKLNLFMALEKKNVLHRKKDQRRKIAM
jgi:hypothetical protein